MTSISSFVSTAGHTTTPTTASVSVSVSQASVAATLLSSNGSNGIISSLSSLSLSSSSSGGIQRVLDALLSSIFAYLDTREICVSSRVNGTWRRLSDRPDIWKSLDLSYSSPHAVTDSICASLFRAHPTIQQVNLKFCSKITNKTIQSASLYLKDLTDLNCEGCGRNIDDKAILILKQCNKLRRLSLDGCSRLTMAGLKQIIQGSSALEELSLNGVSAVNDAVLSLISESKDSSNLHTLRFNSCSALTDAGITGLALRVAHKLRELTISYCASLTDRAIEALANHCPNLTRLNIYGVSNITDRSLASLRLCRHLAYLDLSMCRKITDGGIKALVIGGSSLQWINVYDCTLLTPASLHAIADNCRDIRSIFAFGCDEISRVAVQYLLRTCSATMIRADFGGCLKLPAADIASLAAEFPRVTF